MIAVAVRVAVVVLGLLVAVVFVVAARLHRAVHESRMDAAE